VSIHHRQSQQQSPLIDLIQHHMFWLNIKVGDVLLPGTPNLASTGQQAFTKKRGS